MRIEVLANAHGNLAALEAVMSKLQDAAPDLIVNLGGLVSGPFDPANSAEAQMLSSYVTIFGNHERHLLDGGIGTFDVLARPLLSEQHWAWIRSLPASVTLDEGNVFACHGSSAGGIWSISLKT